MTRAEQPAKQQTVEGTVSETASDSDALAADSRERALRSLLRVPSLRRLWNAQAVGAVGDALAVLVLLLLTLQAAVAEGTLGDGYRGAAFSVAAVLGARILATFLFGAVLLGPLTSLTSPKGPLDRRWTMIASDGVRLALLIVAPLWLDWTPANAVLMLLVTVFVLGVAERFWTVARDGAAPALLPAPPLEGAAVRPLPDHLDALRRLWLRTGFVAIPIAAVVLLVATLVGKALGTGVDWFSLHQAALGSYVAAGLFAASVSVLAFVTLPSSPTPRPRSPLEGLRRPSAVGGDGVEKGRTGAVPLFVIGCAAVAGAVAAAVAVSVLHAVDLGGGPLTFALLVLALTGGTTLGIRGGESVLPTLSRRRLLALALAVTGIALLSMGLVPDTATVVFAAVIGGFAAGVAAKTGHALIAQECEDPRQARMNDHLQAVVRVSIAFGALAAALFAAAIGPQRLAGGDLAFVRGGAAFSLMLMGALLLPVAAVLLAKTDDRSGVPLRRDLTEALRGGADPAQAIAPTGFFIALEGGDGAGKSTQVEALARWIRAKGHEVVVTREPGATPVGKRLRSILLDVSSAGLSNRAEALLYAADRAEHVDSVVRPALERGAIVISDRYIDSSVAYQGAGRDLSPTEIARISRWATDGLVPNLTVLLDVSPATARERFTEAPDRLESEPAEFHGRVRSGFLTLAAGDPGRYLVVDAGQDPEAVTTVVRHRLDQLLPLSEAEVRAQEEARRKAEEELRRKAEEEAARKAEEERLERVREEQLAKLRAEEEARRKAEEEAARQREEERKAEEARQRAEEERRAAEEERRRREAEERAKHEEQERLRRLAEEQARLRAEAEERRLEKQRRAEEALLRAEEARLLAEAAAAAKAAKEAAEAQAAEEAAAKVRAAEEAAAAKARAAERAAAKARAEEAAVAAEAARESAAREAEQTERAKRSERSERSGHAQDGSAGTARGATAKSGVTSGHEVTVPTPIVDPTDPTDPTDPSAQEITVPTPVVGPNDVTQEVPKISGSAPADRELDETAVLPPVRDERLDETAVLPPVRDERLDETAVLPPVRDEEPTDRVPPGIFRDEQPKRRPAGSARSTGSGGRGTGRKPRSDSGPTSRPRSAEEPRLSSAGSGLVGPNDRTRELPQIDPDTGRPRRRSDWAEETPLDDLPTLADELFGSQGDDDERGNGPGRRRGR
ncbi:dTMP kinase [Streptomyces sp. NBC_00690]|uniref:dTMP kinase n=1 Tax=Streptomyces sp. NBC_00690 TaxID=2975808 RepID=UPI002E29902C|nr:dTMP kinase [Streptomyces sp. NBC_00690]